MDRLQHRLAADHEISRRHHERPPRARRSSFHRPGGGRTAPGRATYRGLVHIPKHLKNCKNNTECDALLINSTSRTDTYPAITVRGTGNSVQHEASVSQVSAEQIFYMQQRGLTEAQAMSLSVNGFVNDLVRQFPMEYSVELKRLIELEMEGSVG
jgi:Fe-S cluster assembly protein SufB